MYLTDLADVLRDANLRVVELPGWRTRGRPGSFAPQGNLWHHTGGTPDSRAYAEWMAFEGRGDLPAPLCQLAVARDGTVYVCAAGRANHAGKAKASGPCPAGDGNTLYLGWECMNTGTEGWTAEQRDAMVRGAAATSRRYGWGADHNRAHRETSVTGKWDPGRLDMDKFRADVRETMNGEADMLTDQDVKAITKAIIPQAGDRYLHVVLAQTWSRTAQIAAEQAAQRQLLTELAKGQGRLSDEDVARIESAIADAVVKVSVEVTGAGE